MGQSMACCSNSEVDNNDIKTNNDFTKNNSKLKHHEVVSNVVKIQAAYRGYRDRKLVSQFREMRYQEGGYMNPDGTEFGNNGNYENPDVIQIRQNLGDFNFEEDEPKNLG